MLRPRIYPYKMGSEGAKAVAKGLGCLQVRAAGKYVPKKSHLIINWGSTTVPNWLQKARGQMLNALATVSLATNKLSAFHVMREAGVPIPQYVTTKEGAKELFNDKGIVVCRTVLNGKAGRGIVIAKTIDELVDAPLYTRHVRHRDEYRVHVVNDKVIDFAQKKKRKEREDINILVRNHGSWIFARENVALPDCVRDAAILAVRALGLDFGAVDIGHRVKEDRAYVFEVNTAPGMSDGSTSASKYVAAFKEIAENGI